MLSYQLMQHGLIMCYPIYGTEEHINNDLNEQSHRPTYINLTQIAWWLGTKSHESKSVHTTRFNKSNCNQLMYMSPQQPLQSIQGSFLLNFRLACFLHNKKEHLFLSFPLPQNYRNKILAVSHILFHEYKRRF